MDITMADDISAEYLGLVQGILDNSEFKKLQRYTQHYQTTVSYTHLTLPTKA